MDSCSFGMQGIITHIQRFTVHDGPGIRTMVFFKGCPLRCRWCSNPETQEFFPEIAFNPAFCHPKCTLCVAACPQAAITKTTDAININRALCAACQSHSCAAACPWGALELYGENMSVQAILDIAEEDYVFYRHESGGITLSGGEALARPSFALALLKGAKARHLHTALETCGQVAPEIMEQACLVADYLLFDLKHADPCQHLAGTGKNNDTVLHNLALACRIRQHGNLPLHVRTPVIPGFNANAASISAMGNLLASLGVALWELLPAHNYGEGKYDRLNRARPPLASLEPAFFAELQQLAKTFVSEPPAGISR